MAYTYDFPRPAVTVDALVFLKVNNELKVLLIQRKNEPFAGMWAFPGGFLDEKETCEIAVERELEEETGLTGIKFTQAFTVSTPGRDPRGRTLSVVFYGFTDVNNQIVEAADDAQEAKWFDVESLPEMAFDHSKIIEDLLATYKWDEFDTL